MQLTKLLGANTDRIPPDCQRAIKYIEGRWHEKGAPCDPEGLSIFLDEALKFCSTGVFRYPKFYL